jgi:hypothetical protein
MKPIPFAVVLVLAILCGAAITYVDARPTWDDTGITAGAIFMTCGVFAFLSPSRWWVWALAIGLWIPALGILRTQNYAALLALAVAVFGAVVGMAIRNGLFHKPATNP